MRGSIQLNTRMTKHINVEKPEVIGRQHSPVSLCLCFPSLAPLTTPQALNCKKNENKRHKVISVQITLNLHHHWIIWWPFPPFIKGLFHFNSTILNRQIGKADKKSQFSPCHALSRGWGCTLEETVFQNNLFCLVHPCEGYPISTLCGMRLANKSDTLKVFF